MINSTGFLGSQAVAGPTNKAIALIAKIIDRIKPLCQLTSLGCFAIFPS
jgi:hypothetical protein